MALGQTIVQQLELDARGAVLQRWLAHHLAELIVEAERATGAEKADAETRAVAIILKLWSHRRALPEAVDPLGGYRKAIAVLGRLMPEADPWRRYRRTGGYDDLLHEMFETLSRIVLMGIVLTQVSKATRPIAPAEAKALEDEEVFLREVIDRWMPFFSLPNPDPVAQASILEADEQAECEVVGDGVDAERVSDVEAEAEAEAARAEITYHSAVTRNLERMQEDLANLLARWRRTTPASLGPEGDVADGEEA